MFLASLGLLLTATGVGTSIYGAKQQKRAVKNAQSEQQKEIEAEKKRALAERKKKIDAMRESAIGLSGAGRKSLIGTSETGLLSQNSELKETLG